MIKHVMRLVGGLVLLLAVILIGIFISDNNLRRDEHDRNPAFIRNYWNWGYFKFDPETALEALEQGDTNIFTPLPEHSLQDGALNYPIYWTQADFLRIATAVGQIVWGDPMDLTDWSVNYILLEGNCKDRLGFGHAYIIYFKIEKDRYTTRTIEMYPEYSWVGWGGGNTYRIPVLHKWNRVDLLGTKISADEALRIVSEDAKARFELHDKCNVFVNSPQLDDNKNWHLDFLEAPNDIYYEVNLDTGDYAMRNTK